MISLRSLKFKLWAQWYCGPEFKALGGKILTCKNQFTVKPWSSHFPSCSLSCKREDVNISSNTLFCDAMWYEAAPLTLLVLTSSLEPKAISAKSSGVKCSWLLINLLQGSIFKMHYYGLLGTRWILMQSSDHFDMVLMFQVHWYSCCDTNVLIGGHFDTAQKTNHYMFDLKKTLPSNAPRRHFRPAPLLPESLPF